MEKPREPFLATFQGVHSIRLGIAITQKSLLDSSWFDAAIDSECDNTQNYLEWARDAIALLVRAEGEHMRRWGNLEIHWDDLRFLAQMELPHSQSDLFQGMRYPTPALKRLAPIGVRKAFEGVLPAMPALQTLIMEQGFFWTPLEAYRPT